MPYGLEDVTGYPRLFAELAKDPQWSDEDLKKLAGLNIIRVMKDVEAVSNDLPAMWGGRAEGVVGERVCDLG